MKMYDLIEGTEHDVRTVAGLDIVTSGPYWTADIRGADGSFVIVYWAEDGNGNVTMVWEHTMTHFSRIEPTGEIRHFTTT